MTVEPNQQQQQNDRIIYFKVTKCMNILKRFFCMNLLPKKNLIESVDKINVTINVMFIQIHQSSEYRM